MTRTLSVAGAITVAVDTLAALTALGSETAPSRQIPAGRTKVTRIIVAFCGDGALDAGTAMILRLSGNAFPGGPHAIPFGSTGGEITASADQTANVGLFVLDTDIDCVPGNIATIQVDYGGVDPGSPAVGVTLYFG